MASAAVTLKLTTTEYDLVKECLQAQRKALFEGPINDTLAHHEQRELRRKVIALDDLIRQLA